MKQLLFLVFLFTFLITSAQKTRFTIHRLSLPDEIAYYNNQFSGLYIHNEQLFLMSESRLEDSAEGKLYAINLADLDRKMADTAYTLPWKKYHIYNLELVRAIIDASGQSYEGLEAMVIDSNTIYLSVETATPSSNCYLLKGILNDTAVVIDTGFLISLPKPVSIDGAHIYNAGFEAMEKKNNSVFNFFEYNDFPAHNYVYALHNTPLNSNSPIHPMPLNRLPFRITDITNSGDHLTAINYFYKGEGGDTIYRTPDNDSVNQRLIKDKAGYKNYCRLINISYIDKQFTWEPLWEFPEQYQSYNWEGIAAYKGGFFIINDKYTPARPYMSTLLYLEPK